MKASLYTVFFALILGVLDASLLTWAGRFTAPYREANAQAEEYRNVLGVLKVPHEPDARPDELLEIFKENVRTEERNGLTLYQLSGTGGGAVAVQLAGPGVWGPMRGFLALDPDFRTIRALSFYKQEETPGLGGEIAADWFVKQFVGKSTSNASGTPGIRIVRGGGSSGVNEIDAISGATMTCDKVQILLNDTITRLIGEK